MLLPDLPRQYIKPGLKLIFDYDHGLIIELRDGMIVTKWKKYGLVVDYPKTFLTTFIYPKQAITNNKVII